MTFQLMRLRPDPVALAVWATRQGLLSPDGDYGYAFHALLKAAFGEPTPGPFRYLGGAQGLLAYTCASLEEMRLNAERVRRELPDIARALGLESLDARPFPTSWKTAQRLGFEVRVRPVVRVSEGPERQGFGEERDAFLHAVHVSAESGNAGEHGGTTEREAVYRDWLARQLGTDGAARIDDAHMDAFQLTRVIRKKPPEEGGKRPITKKSGPDAVFKGQLQVGDPEAFAKLLARGVGRHRAFGFGMLLLKPAAQC